MRTTVRFDDELLRAIKHAAAERGCTMTEVIEDAVRAALLTRRPADRRPVDLPVWRGSRLLPGVDLDDSASLYDIMEGRG